MLSASASDAPHAAKPAAEAAKPAPDAAKKTADAAAKLAAELAKPAKAIEKPAAEHGAKAAPSIVAKPLIDKPLIDKSLVEKPPKAAVTAATADKAAAAISAPDDEDQVDLSVRIAERLAEMRAKQAARVAAAAKAKKAADARRKKEAALAVVAAAPKVSTHWDYDGEFGPDNWGKINPAWSQCGKGNRQSPIDIRDGIKVDLDEIDFDYRPSTFTEIDNGHTVQVNLARGNFLNVGVERFELVQFHFHRPSEEKINGKGTEMVIHLVHRDARGRLAVVAVLLERGKANDAIQTVWNNIPLEKGQLGAPGIELDAFELLPNRREYYTYMGSLTEPPCTENVLWIVMKQPMTASPAQMALFSRLYPLNARPVQASEGRMVKESN
ncbi:MULTISPECIES: carbonic anhydrase [unclassified Massilia]|uniref:carbonic anhydrase n=1 Tax=unclassified Massilia TaxID=2609279 RepID=UPI001E2F7126|nr:MULTISPECIES: carbonic anhydrase family protein [unclassified Massilia]